jgi:hypothetical protein
MVGRKMASGWGNVSFYLMEYEKLDSSRHPPAS